MSAVLPNATGYGALSTEEPYPPHTYTEWAIRRPGDAEVMNSHLAEMTAREWWARYIDHGEPVELVKRQVTIRQYREVTRYEVVEP